MSLMPIGKNCLDGFLGKSICKAIDLVDNSRMYFFKLKMNKKYEHFNEGNNTMYLIDGKKIPLIDLYCNRERSEVKNQEFIDTTKKYNSPTEYKRLSNLWN